MKNIETTVTGFAFAVLFLGYSCGKVKNGSDKPNTSGSESQTTPNDSSATNSKAALGVGEDNQKKVLGYPSNQSNLNSDSTSKRHDDDTITKKPLKDKPNKHQ